MKHTPGPWRFKIGDSFSSTDYIVEQVSEDEQGWLVMRWEPGPYRSGELEQANGQLIATAPELLDSLRILYEETADYIRLNHLGDVHHNRSMQYARDTIAKAEWKT